MNDKTITFIARAQEIHGDKYVYTNVIYTNNHEKVEIICSKHGAFSVQPKNHLNGNGCKLCATEKKSENFSKTTDEFIAEARKVHGDKYDYNRVNYTNQYTKIEIGHPDGYWFW
jgi:hypothetical protein